MSKYILKFYKFTYSLQYISLYRKSYSEML